MLHIYIIFRKFFEMSYQPIVSIVKIAKKNSCEKSHLKLLARMNISGFF